MQAFQITWPVLSTTGVCSAQTLGAAGSLVIDGPTLYSPDTMVGIRRAFAQLQSGNLLGPPSPVIQRIPTLTSSGNVSGANITITGKNLAGTALSKTRAGPSGNTVNFSDEFSEIDSISSDAALGTAMSVGWGSTGTLAWYLVDQFKVPTSIFIEGVITATLSCTPQYTPDDPSQTTSPTAINDPLGAQTATFSIPYASPPGAIRAIINSSDATGKLVFTIRQAGVN